MKEKFLTFLNSYFWLAVIIFLILTGAMTFSLYRNWEQSRFERTVSNQTFEANKAVREAQNANNQAANYDVERRTEDVLRIQTIEPKLQQSRRKSANSKIELEKARTKYSDEKIIHKNISSSVVDNCLKLRELFPDSKFEYCAGEN